VPHLLAPGEGRQGWSEVRVICKRRADLPAEYGCRQCGATKPIKKMVLVRRRKTRDYLLRPRCKDCHNENEKGHRREYKTKYLRRWRENNAEVNESYWRGRDRAASNATSYKHFTKNHAAILIQGRLHRAGVQVSLREARSLLRQYGRCYPTSFGLTEKGKRECERIRSRFRNARYQARKRGMKEPPAPRPIEIRMMVYADGRPDHGRPDPAEAAAPDAFVIPPRLQPVPFRVASKRLKEWHRSQSKLKKPRSQASNIVNISAGQSNILDSQRVALPPHLTPSEVFP
jgi:hypothetical protein